MDDLRQAVARIDENIKQLLPIIPMIQDHDKQIALIKNDDKWRRSIFHGFFGLLGVIIGALAEFLRK